MTRYLACLFLIMYCLAGPAIARQSSTVVLLVTLEGISLDQLLHWNLTALSSLLDHSALGVMNNRTAGIDNSDDVAVTISAGTRARGSTHNFQYAGKNFTAVEFEQFDRSHNAAVIRDRLMQTGIVNMYWHEIESLNAELRYRAVPGMLGELLERNGISTWAFGNSDTSQNSSRPAAVIAMNRQGYVAHGDVSKAFIVAGSPDRSSIQLKHITSLLNGRHFIVVEAGSASRPDAINDCFDFINQVKQHLTAMGQNHLIILAVIKPNDSAAALNDRLLPVIMTGNSIQPGLLFSSTTREPGLLVNYDLTATILHHFGIPADESMLGSPVSVLPSKHAPDIIQRLNHQKVATYNARTPISFGYGVLLALVFISTLVLLHPVARTPARLTHIVATLLRLLSSALLIAPIAFLLAPLFHCYTTLAITLSAVVFSLGIAAVLHMSGRDSHFSFAVIGLGSVIVIGCDLLTGSALMKNSVLGYQAISGLRYYGLGNEYAGFLVGSWLLGTASMLERTSGGKRYPFLIIIASGIALFYLIGSPRYGTDFGGMLAMATGTSITLALILGKRAWKRWLALITGIALIMLTVLLVTNAYLPPEEQSHIGRTMMIGLQRPGYLCEVASRKIAMNMQLVIRSLWIVIPTLLLAASGCLGYYRQKLHCEMAVYHPHLHCGFVGIVVAAVTGFLVNDSGVVTLGTTLLYVFFPTISLLLARVHNADSV